MLIRPKAGILDPQGVAVERALPALGFAGVANVHIGRLVELDVEDARSSSRCARSCSPTRWSRTTRSAARRRRLSAVKFGVLRSRLLRRGRRAARPPGASGDAELIWHRDRDLRRRRRDRRPRRLLLRRLPARRRDRALLAGDGVGDRVRRATAGSCWASATAFRCCARRACCRARCSATRTCASPSARCSWRCVQRPAGRSRARAQPGERLSIPAKHAWGRYYADEDTLAAMERARPDRAALRARRELQRLAARHRRRVQRARATCSA